jgi:hypothetical protein
MQFRDAKFSARKPLIQLVIQLNPRWALALNWDCLGNVTLRRASFLSSLERSPFLALFSRAAPNAKGFD